MHTFKNLVKHKKEQHLLLWDEAGGRKGKEESNLQNKIYIYIYTNKKYVYIFIMNVLARYMNVKLNLEQSVKLCR